MEPKHRAGVVVDLLLVVRGEQERRHRAGRPGSRFDHVRHVPLVGLRVEVVELLPRRRGVRLEVEVGALGDALELVEPPREPELDVGRTRRVVRQLVGVVRAEEQHVGRDAELDVPVEPLVAPVLVPLASLSAGGTKNSISICSNSRVRKIQFCGVISLRKLLPTWAMPNGGFLRAVWSTCVKFVNMPCAVSGRR